jgi:thymidine phosphorylase
VQVGEAVAVGQPFAWLHANDLTGLPEARALLAGAFTVGEAPVQPPPLVADRLRE